VKKTFDLSVYFIADPSLCSGRDVSDVVRLALSGGATMVQYRDKSGDLNAINRNAAILQKICDEFAAAFLINDHVDLAQTINADGVHLGQGDMSAAEARRVLGPDAIIGITAFTPVHMTAIDPGIVDYAGTGPVYPTQTDKGKQVLGPEKFAQLVKLCPVQVVGIGGITPENAAPVLHAGAQGVAMMRAISAAPDPKEAAMNFKDIVAAARMQKAS
jgi:thiamine-phosphate pyrophosphorylase